MNLLMEGGQMSSDPAKAVYVRLDDDLLARIDRYNERLRARQPGLRPTRSDVIRVLLVTALDTVEREGQ